MQLVRWSFHNLAVAMIEDDDGELRCTSQALCNALGITSKSLEHMRRRHPEHLSPVSPPQRGAKEFFRENMAEFGLQRVRADLMLLWSVDDMIAVAHYSTSPAALDFTKAIVQLVKREARKDLITQEQFDELSNRMQVLESARASMQAAASAAGVALQAQRATKPLRLN